MAPTPRNRLARIEKRKKLSALFQVGEYVNFGPGGVQVPEGEPYEMRVYIASPNPLQRDEAMRQGAARRAQVTLDARKNEGSEEWNLIRSFVAGLTFLEVVDMLLTAKETEFLGEARAEVLKEDEWDDFHALQDAMREYQASDEQDDEKWASLIDRDIEFGRQVLSRAAELRATEKDTLKIMPREKVDEQAIDLRIEAAGTGAFVNAYEKWMMFFCVRDDEDHDELYFETPEELQAMPTPFQNAVAGILAGFITEAAEAKN